LPSGTSGPSMKQKTLHSVIYKLIILFGIKKKLPWQWKEHIIVPVYKNGNKISCTDHQKISLELTV
jgi:hypothetical protein